MQNKWFSSWRNQDDSNGQINRTQKPATGVHAEHSPENRVATTQCSANGFAASGVDLPAFEEIYHSAGIKGPRQGYTIGKVVEMLQSEHIGTLTPEVKRSALLMALDAAGVQVEEVLQDATLRQRAINSYEAVQRKRLEEYEACKAQENCAIQAEIERVVAEYTARISGNLDDVAREKDSFRNWQVRKQHEAGRIAEAVALCVTRTSSANTKPPADRTAAFGELAAVLADPVFVHRS